MIPDFPDEMRLQTFGAGEIKVIFIEYTDA